MVENGTTARSKNGQQGTIERTVLQRPATHGHLVFSHHLAGSHSISENSSYLSHSADMENSGGHLAMRPVSTEKSSRALELIEEGVKK